MFFTYLALGVAVTAIIRIVPLLVLGKPELTTGDVINHLNLIDACRERKWKTPDLRHKFLLADPESYPHLFHQILAYLPSRVVDLLEPVFGTIVESLHAVMLFCVAYYAGAHVWNIPDPAWTALLATLMFAAAPIHLGMENHGRVLRLSPRPIGVLIGTATMLGAVAFQTTGHWGWMAYCCTGVAIAIWTSKFAVQAIVFLTVFQSILTFDARLLMMLPLGAVLGTIISGGQTTAILRGSIHHSTFYFTFLRYRTSATTTHTWGKILNWPVLLFKSPVEAARMLITDYVMVSFTLFPWTVLFVSSYIVHPQWMKSGDVLEPALFWWCCAGYLAMFATSLRALQFLGEAYRYVKYATTPICILTAWRVITLNDARLWWVAAGCACVSAICIGGSYLVNYLARQAEPDRAALYEWIKTQPQSTLLTIHMRLSFLLCFRTPHRAVNWHTNAPEGENLTKYKALIPKYYPWPAMDLDSIVKQYGVDLLIIDEQAISSVEKRDPSYKYDFSNFDEVWRHGRYYALRPRMAAANPVSESQVRAA